MKKHHFILIFWLNFDQTFQLFSTSHNIILLRITISWEKEKIKDIKLPGAVLLTWYLDD